MKSLEQQKKQFLTVFAEALINGKITPEQACSLIENVRDTKMFPDDMETEDERQKGFNEIAWTFADWKITTEEACEAFNEWIDEGSLQRIERDWKRFGLVCK